MNLLLLRAPGPGASWRGRGPADEPVAPIQFLDEAIAANPYYGNAFLLAHAICWGIREGKARPRPAKPWPRPGLFDIIRITENWKQSSTDLRHRIEGD